MGAEDRHEFLKWATDSLYQRWQIGEERYQSDKLGFQGAPVEHAIEETLDNLIYLFMAKREKDFMLERIAQQVRELKGL